jgi:hypothetical protein
MGRIRDSKSWDAGYADGLAARPYGTDPLHKADGFAYSAGYRDGQTARRKEWISDEARDTDG